MRVRARRGPRRARAARRGRRTASASAVDGGDVAVHREHGVGDDERAGAARRRSSASSGRGRRGGRPRPRPAARRQPSMIDAWLSSSEHDEHVRARRTSASTPRLAAKPVGNSSARARCPSSRRARPRARRARAASRRSGGPRPRRRPSGRARRARPRRTAGCCVEAEVVVRRERDDRPAVAASVASGPAASRSRGARQRPGGADRARASRRRPSRASVVTVAADLVDRAPASASTMRSSSADGDRERRHEHDDVAERAQQHAPLDARRRRPAGPSAGRRPAAPARRRP